MKLMRTGLRRGFPLVLLVALLCAVVFHSRRDQSVTGMEQKPEAPPRALAGSSRTTPSLEPRPQSPFAPESFDLKPPEPAREKSSDAFGTVTPIPVAFDLADDEPDARTEQTKHPETKPLTSPGSPAVAHSGHSARRNFSHNRNRPISIDDIPPGTLRSQISRLTPEAKEVALNALSQASFQGSDASYMRAAANGEIHCACTFAPPPPGYKITTKIPSGKKRKTSSSARSAARVESDGPVDEAPGPVPSYTSFSGAEKSIYLDFDGHITSGTGWNLEHNLTRDIHSQGFDLDGDPETFSSQELSAIHQIWQIIAEDFLPFHINVTTIEPPLEDFTAGDTAIRLVISDNLDFNPAGEDGGEWYNSAASGVAYLHSFGFTRDTPCFVFPDKFFSPDAIAIANAGSHEIGHTLGLSHDGKGALDYYPGHGFGALTWAPIMGNGLYQTVVQWSKGEYQGATNSQPDISIITGGLNGNIGFRPDGIGDTNGTAVDMPYTPDGFGSLEFDIGSIIQTESDIDVYRIVSAPGAFVAVASPDPFAPNLDIELSLYDIGGNLLVTSNPENFLSANISTTLAPNVVGTFFLHVRGVGKGTVDDGYSEYGSLGRYRLQGSYPEVIGPPLNVKASDGSSLDHIAITWDAVPGASRYRVVRNTTPDPLTAELRASLGAGNLSLNDSFLTPVGTVYYYWVRTELDDDTFSSFSIPDTGYIGTTPPTPIVSATDGDYLGKITLTWNAIADAGVYDVYRGTLANGSNRTLRGTLNGSLDEFNNLGPPPTTWNDNTPGQGETYWYWVQARRGFITSNFGPGEQGSTAVGSPTPPTNVQASDGEFPDRIHITWTPGDFNEGITIDRGTMADGSDRSFYTSVPDPLGDYEDTDIVVGQVYYYWLKSFGGGLPGGSSAPDSGYAGSGFPQWIVGFFPGEVDPAIIGAFVDTESDGLVHLVEYAFDLNPTIFNSPTEIQVLDIQSIDGQPHFCLTFVRDSALSDIDYIVETSTTQEVNNWVVLDDLEILQTNGSRDTVRACKPVTGGPEVFFRIRIVANGTN